MTQALVIPAEADAAGKLVFLLENLETQLADTTAFAITVSEVTSAKALPNATAVDVVTTAPATGSYGYTQAQAAAVLTEVNALVADVEAIRQLLATIVTALANVGVLTIV